MLVTTHHIDEVEGFDRVCILDRGKILAEDTPDGLRRAHGQVLLRVSPRDTEAAAGIRAFAPDVREAADGALVLRVPDAGFVDGFLARFGTRIVAMRLDKSTLETVFLALTGRELRDQAAGPRERTLAFGRRGGDIRDERPGRPISRGRFSGLYAIWLREVKRAVRDRGQLVGGDQPADPLGA